MLSLRRHTLLCLSWFEIPVALDVVVVAPDVVVVEKTAQNWWSLFNIFKFEFQDANDSRWSGKNLSTASRRFLCRRCLWKWRFLLKKNFGIFGCLAFRSTSNVDDVKISVAYLSPLPLNQFVTMFVFLVYSGFTGSGETLLLNLSIGSFQMLAV